MQVAQKENERRIIEAKTKREAVIAEVRGVVKAQVSEASAQLKAWEARGEQVRRKLEADVVAPANANKAQSEANAKAQAATVAAQGRAAAAALTSLATAYQAGGRFARESLLLQKLLPVFEQLTSTMKALRIDRLTVLSQPAAGGGGSQLGPALVTTNEQVRAATGVDLLGTLQRRMTASSPPAKPASPKE